MPLVDYRCPLCRAVLEGDSLLEPICVGSTPAGLATPLATQPSGVRQPRSPHRAVPMERIYSPPALGRVDGAGGSPARRSL